jgi:hypothetical protein
MPMREERVEQQIQRTFGPFLALLCTLGYTAKRLATLGRHGKLKGSTERGRLFLIIDISSSN